MGRSTRALVLRSVTLALIVVGVVGALGAVFLSPLALRWIATDQRVDWSQLSDVGQTYGAASAILAALALGGVAVSLFLQRKESKAAREQALRGLHTDLLRMALDDPEFMECWGIIGESGDMGWHRQHIYLNLIVSHWQMMWEMNVLTERHLRILARGIFGGSRGLRYWSEARDVRLVAEKGRRAREFHTVVDDEYLIARARGNATSEDSGSKGDAGQPETVVAPDSIGTAESEPWKVPAERLAWFGLGMVTTRVIEQVLGRRNG